MTTTNRVSQPPSPHNEAVLGFLPGSAERASLKDELARQSAMVVEIPCYIAGEEVYTGNTVDQVMPHDHGHVIAKVHLAGPEEVARACEAAVEAQGTWGRMDWEQRAAVFLRAAELLAGPRRDEINAATMLNQSKTCYQAEIDSACELIDFFRFNVDYARDIYEDLQPPISGPGVWNSSEVRPLEGFVLAVTPFNFTSIAGNLSSAPALMGNTVVWKPSKASYLSNWKIMQLLIDSGLPAGVINFIPGKPQMIVDTALSNPDFAGLHFTGSTTIFQGLWKQISEALPRLRSYPRIVGETGGKDFIVAHSSADRKGLLVALLRGAFEYQGQKCSAASRAYIAASVWNDISADLVKEVEAIKIGDPRDFRNLMTAVIHQSSFDKCVDYIEHARNDESCNIIVGGGYDDGKGWFVEPTIILTTDSQYRSIKEEIFGPILTIMVYDDDDFEGIMDICDRTSPYALTGSIFADDRDAIDLAMDALRYSAGNFYINDKPTGAVVGQQPFGGARWSGTNDKAGSPLNLLRWVSPRSIKETFIPPQDWSYGFLDEE
ncbi:MAG: L-glutamate gamma-semialdehyde dehydrogenase [Candidatus Poseidoniaceae archaeon]|nr:L-glutamate gamma-semialdehyde dehydrogenase [Candidatus Poseidoniaceae archaeon]MDP7203710.1 L-glutamate gamma-semialdehyde dehydrogenase [Candidatus Poseidoniaceae archaeon]